MPSFASTTMTTRKHHCRENCNVAPHSCYFSSPSMAFPINSTSWREGKTCRFFGSVPGIKRRGREIDREEIGRLVPVQP
jgi:hypothetical protein